MILLPPYDAVAYANCLMVLRWLDAFSKDIAWVDFFPLAQCVY